MKNNPILKLNRLVMIIPAVLMLLSLSSCRQEEPYSNPTPPGSTLVNLSVSASNSDAAPASDDLASAIKTLCILQFNARGNGFGTLRHVGIGKEDAAGNGKYSATLLQSIDTNDKYKFVVLANLPDGYGIFQRMIGRSYAEVQQACLSGEITGNLGFDANNSFPMFGIPKNGTPEVIDETLDLGSVSLLRAVGRVDIGIGKKSTTDNTWTKNGVKFNMTQVQIWKAGKQYAYMPLESNFSSSGGTLTITAPSPVGGVNTDPLTYSGTDIITNGTFCAEKIYLPEADLLWADGGVVYDANHANRLAIIVGGVYNNSKKETFYRVDFTKDDGSNEKMNILRNHVYQFTIKSVTDHGYGTAELAYNSKPKDFDFTADVTEWQPGKTASVPSVIGFRISYGKLNGENLVWDTGIDLEIPQKRTSWSGYNSYWTFNYNEFYGESFIYYGLTHPMGYSNGRLYPTVADAFKYEGAYLNLMVSGDDIVDVDGNSGIQWKTGTTLTAFDICRNYQGEGYNDWRLPRLSELALLYLNRESLEKVRGFTPFSNETYWSASEYLVSYSIQDQKHSERAWCIDFGKPNPGNAIHQAKSELLKIRCVRQM